MFICFVPGSPRLDSATRGAGSASTVYVKKCNKVVLLSTSWVIVNFLEGSSFLPLGSITSRCSGKEPAISPLIFTSVLLHKL